MMKMAASRFDLNAVRMRTIAQCQAAVTAALSDIPIAELARLEMKIIRDLREAHFQAMQEMQCVKGVKDLCALDAATEIQGSPLSRELREALSVWCYAEAMIVELQLVRMRTPFPRVRVAAMYKASVEKASGVSRTDPLC